MNLVRTYCNFLHKIKEAYGAEESIVCLLLLDPTNEDTVGRYIYRRFDYFDYRTGEYVDFYCPGFDADDNGRYFSVKDFVEFIRYIEATTKWQYNGGTNLLLLRYADGKLHFDNVYDLNFTRLLIDGVISDYNCFIEKLIRSLQYDVECYIHNQYIKHQVKNIWSALSEILPQCISKAVGYIRNSARLNDYFTPKDFTK